MKPFYCMQCPRKCGVLRGDEMPGRGLGACKMGALPAIARAAKHFDEEPPISGEGGSGTVFFSGCSLRCVYCQNAEISLGAKGEPRSLDELRTACQRLIDAGVHNINWVNPTHYAHVLEQLLNEPLHVPSVYNTGGYERVSTLKRLDGKVRIYLTDLKYLDAEGAKRYSGAPDYPKRAPRAILEMQRQVGQAQFDDSGVMKSGLIIRHLILPGRTDEAIRALEWISANAPAAYVSLMAQYVPAGQLKDTPELQRPITRREYDRVVDRLFQLNISNGFVQELESADEKYIPPFDFTGVFF